MRIITFVTQKGGTGKTTLATSLAVAAIEAGETVAVLDLDPQLTTSEWGKDRDRAHAKAEKAGNTADAERLASPHVQPFPMARIAELPALVRGSNRLLQKSVAARFWR